MIENPPGPSSALYHPESSPPFGISGDFKYAAFQSHDPSSHFKRSISGPGCGICICASAGFLSSVGFLSDEELCCARAATIHAAPSTNVTRVIISRCLMMLFPFAFLFGYLLAFFQSPTVLPAGSIIHANVPVGMVIGGTRVFPPSFA